MIHKKIDPISYLQFSLLQQISCIHHGTLLKTGGISPPPYHSLNFTVSTGDDPANIKKNLEKVQTALTLPKIVMGHQTHSTNIAWVDANSPDCIPNTDGLITQTPDIALMILHADCQAALFIDRITKTIANIHCGWRGNVSNIYAKTIQEFIKIGSDPKNILVCISPSLGPKHAEFIHYEQEFPKEFHPFQETPNYFNLWEIARYQLENLGIQASHIEMANICTYANSGDFFSHRREKITGRNATFIYLTQENREVFSFVG